ncbi:MAG: hypothetical protein JXR80_03770 [Deltaproteobacteria bacterium]|nr:hypothetical protein [Deltaproteobacteria bacterium]
MYDFIHDNPSVESYPASHINDPCVIAMNDKAVSIYSAVEMDLFGQVNSEFVGGHEFSGVGGQRDFMNGAFRSKSGSLKLTVKTKKAPTVKRLSGL